MKLFEILNFLNSRVPLAFQEQYDNCGLLIGNHDLKINSVLVSLDCTESVIDEAIKNKDNLIISHHPIIFTGIKKITGSSYVDRIIQKAIKHDIAIYAMHTNLDNIFGGVSFEIAKHLLLDHVDFLKPKSDILTKLTTYCPSNYTNVIKKALFDVGAGSIGSFYDHCSFTNSGIGTFRPLDGANPFIGKVGQESEVQEERLELVFYSYLKPEILTALHKVHPYQEVAYTFDNINNNAKVGSGVVGELKKSMRFNEFLKYVKDKMKCSMIRYNSLVEKKDIKKVAICGGSGKFLLNDAIKSNADVFITSDFKYHDFFDCDNKIIVFDIGHYESEYLTQKLIMRILKENFSKLAVRITNVCTNPILYY